MANRFGHVRSLGAAGQRCRASACGTAASTTLTSRANVDVMWRAYRSTCTGVADLIFEIWAGSAAPHRLAQQSLSKGPAGPFYFFLLLSFLPHPIEVELLLAAQRRRPPIPAKIQLFWPGKVRQIVPLPPVKSNRFGSYS